MPKELHPDGLIRTFSPPVCRAPGEIGLSSRVCQGKNEVAMKVLIAESDLETVDNISIAINLYLPNFELITADSVKQCLDMVKNNSLNMVILGDLADISGLDVIKKIRSYSEVPIMVLSHKNDEYLLVKALDAGANGYMTKPFQQLELMARIRTLLRGKQSNKQYE